MSVLGGIIERLRRDLDREVETRIAEAMVAGMDLVVWERMDFDLKKGATGSVAFRLLPPRRYAPGETVPGITPSPEGFEGRTVTCRLIHSGGRELLHA